MKKVLLLTTRRSGSTVLMQMFFHYHNFFETIRCGLNEPFHNREIFNGNIKRLTKSDIYDNRYEDPLTFVKYLFNLRDKDIFRKRTKGIKKYLIKNKKS
jgi:hypothetical protein